MNKRKIGVAIGLCTFFIAVFMVSFLWWKSAENHSKAEGGSTSTVTVPNNYTSGQNIIYFNSSFYNYKYDNEIDGKEGDQGAQSCYDGGVVPFGAFDTQLSNYYQNNNVKVGIYTGNFYNYYGGLASKKIEFPGYWYFRWSANIANRHVPYDAVCQNIVANQLDGFDNTSSDVTRGTLQCEKNDPDTGTVAMPYFDKNFLKNTVNNIPIGEVKENVGFPFREITSGERKGYYEFDSEKDVVRFNTSSTNQLDYYYDSQKVYCAASDKAQFFPYNNTNGQGKLASNSTAQKKLDYGFGVRFNIPFRLSDDGTKDGKPMVFEFRGDDDVWVFLDGKLVLDLGGDHGPVTGTIDFSDVGAGGTKKIKTTVSKVAYAKDSTNASDTVMSDKILESDTYVKSNVSTTVDNITKGPNTEHVLTIFYMERGMFESNFQMSFNFVPVPADATPTPAPTATPAPQKVSTSSLKIQNKLIMTDNKGKSIINPAFQQTVYNMTEDDVFRYSIANKGTTADQVEDSGINYPSGKLTVRQNQKTSKKDKSYLSFGAEPKVRIYFDLKAAMEQVPKEQKDKYNFINNSEICIYVWSDGVKNGYAKLDKYNDEIYYYDFKQSMTRIKFGNNDGSHRIDTGDDFKIKGKEKNGYMFKANGSDTRNNDHIKLNGEWKEPTTNYPALPERINYSEGLPYQEAGSTPAPTFSPSAANNDFSNVSNTSYELKEAYPAPTSTAPMTTPKILSNSASTAGITDANGEFNLFYDDSATFKNQFAKNSRMKVEQQENLLQPSRYSGKITETSDPDDVLTKFVTPSPTAKIRKASDYYYTTVTAASISGSMSTPIDVTYDNQFNYTNGSADGDLNITENFTNTIKTGSLTIAKELKGNANEDSSYSYTYTIYFSSVFGASDTTSSSFQVYKGTYKKSRETTEQTTTDGKITLHPGEKAVISGIPVGTKYKIEESVKDKTVVTDMKVTYKATIDSDSDAITSPEYHGSTASSGQSAGNTASASTTSENGGITVNKTDRTIEGVIPCSITNKKYNTSTSEYKKVDVEVTYTNQFGSISITKRLTGDVNESQYYQNIENTEKTYIFKVKKGDALYSGNYKLYTYENGNGDYTSPTVTTTTKNITNGSITLKQNQKAELCELPLTALGSAYTVQEIFDYPTPTPTSPSQISDTTDIFYLESINVPQGTATPTTSSAITTMTLSDSNPSVQLVYTNRYSNSFIQIDKYVDALYYGDAVYGGGITYQDLTRANQNFVFTVKQYKTKAEAEAGTATPENPENTFRVTLSTKDAEKAKIKVGDKGYYKISKKLKVVANRYYRITEDTDWSWKYKLAQVGFSTNFRQENFQDAIFAKLLPSTSGTSESSTANEQNTKTVLASDAKSAAVILKSNRDEKALPIAQFYNQLKVPGSNETPFPEGDTDDAVNEIKKTK
jgi:fibro-slime domain-containing protein